MALEDIVNQIGQQAATPVMPQPAPPTPGSVDDLEQRAHASLFADLQNRAAAINPPPQPGQLSPGNPFNEQINQLSAQLRATAPDPTPQRGIKGLLSNFLQGGGAAMMHEAGLQTPYEKRQQALQDFAHYNQLAGLWENNQTEMAYRQALLGQLDDNRRFQSQLQPLELQGRQLQNQSLAYNIQQQQNTVHPAMTADDLQSLGLSPNLSRQFGGKPLSSADMQALMQMSSLAGQNQKVFDYGSDDPKSGTPNKGIWLVDRQYNGIKQLSPTSETGRSVALAKIQLNALAADRKAAGMTGYAFNPQTNETVLTNAAEARNSGYLAFRPVKEGDIRKDTLDTKILNDIAAKSNNVTKASLALDQDQDQRNIIAWAIDAASKDQQFALGAFGTKIPAQWLNNFMNSANMTKASQQTKDYIISVLSLREAAMGMQRLLTGSARSNESQIQALQSTLPGFENNSGLALQKMQNFTQNLDMLRQGLPKLPGITSIPVLNPSTQPIEPGQSINAPLPSGFEAPSTQAPASSASLGYSPISYQPDHPIVQQGARMLGTTQQQAQRRLRRIGLLRTT